MGATREKADRKPDFPTGVTVESPGERVACKGQGGEKKGPQKETGGERAGIRTSKGESFSHRASPKGVLSGPCGEGNLDARPAKKKKAEVLLNGNTERR